MNGTRTNAAPPPRDEGVFEMPSDGLLGEPIELSAALVAALDARVHSIEEVVLVASLLARVPKFPIDMLDEVLVLADFMITFEAETREEIYGRDEMNHVYVELRPQAPALPPGISIDPQCKELVVECVSHDQGWASQDNEYDFTYKASFTWAEVAVVKHIEDGVATEVTRETAITNVRATRRWRHHIKAYKDPAGLLRNVSITDTTQLILRSQYPGWGNFAKFGRIRARFAITISEDAKLLTFEQIAQIADWNSTRQDKSVMDMLCSLQ